MKLIQEMTHGFFVNRLKRKGDVWKTMRILHMQDVAYFTGDQVVKPEKSEMKIYESDKDAIVVGHVGDVVLGKTMGSAMVIDEAFDGCLINSNFVLIKIDKKCSPYFLAWYMNESSAFKRYLFVNQQGSTSTKVLSITDLKAFNYKSIDYVNENLIGEIYKKQVQRKRLLVEQEQLEIKLMNQHFKISRKKEIENE